MAHEELGIKHLPTSLSETEMEITVCSGGKTYININIYLVSQIEGWYKSGK